MDDSTPTQEWTRDTKTPVDPDTPVEHRFLLRLRDHPDDLAMRMVFADWLEETGRADKAAIVRAFAEPRADDAPPLVLTTEVEREWLAIVSRAPIERCDVRFRFQCPKAWESLTSTDDATVRHCGTCEKPVFFCSDLTEVRVHGGAKRCVAFSPRLLRTEALAEYEDEATGSTMMMGEIDVDPGEWLEDAPTLVR